MTDPLFDLVGRVIVVTGGLGQLGRAFSIGLADRGAQVAILDSDASPARTELLADRADDENLLVLEADVTDRDSLMCALTAIEARWGTPFGLVNNAGLDSPPGAPATENGPFESYPDKSWDRVMAVNAKGPFLCCQVFGGAMAAAGSGSIVNVASIYGLLSPDQRLYDYRRKRGETFFKPVAYAASKSALYNLTRYLATYWGARGVRVNTVTFAGVFDGQDEAFLSAYEQKVPLGRMAQPTDYLGPIVYLLSGASCYMTGANLVVDGGFTAW